MSFLSIPITDWIFLVVFFVILTLCVNPLGIYMAKVFKGERVFLSRLFYPIEKIIYSFCNTSVSYEMDWKEYTKSVFIFSFGSLFLLFLLLYLQDFPNISADLAFNAAASFVTNTGWQSYSPEKTLTLQTQIFSLLPQAALSASVALAVMVAMIRGLSQSYTRSLGNFWVDLTRSVLYIILPISTIFSIFYISQGSIQTFANFISFHTLENGTLETITAGPVATFTSMKLLTATGSGYYSASGAHPFENATSLSNFVQMINMLLIQVACASLYGKFVGDRKQGTSLYVSMLILFIPLMLISISMEQSGNPLLNNINIDQHLGQMEGKELRIGSMASCLWSSITTATANGSTNSSIDSFLPLTSMIPLIFIHTGEVIFGGVGSGLYSLLIYVIITVFIGSLMIGRSPEFLGKKVGVFEIQMSSLVILITLLTSLLGTSIAVMTEAGRMGASNPSYQGFSEILYAFSSASVNNGSAFAGIKSNTIFYNIILGIIMIITRLGIIWAVLALAGSMGKKVRAKRTHNSLDTSSGTFIILLVAVVILIDIITFMPSIALSSVAEHFYLMSGVK